MRGAHVIVSLLLWVAALPVAAQTERERGEREGPYRSRMRVIDERAPVIPQQPPADDAFSRALNARAKGYLAAANGDVNGAITELRAALETGILAPVAARAVAQDLLSLLARDERHEQVVDVYRQLSQDSDIAPEVSMAVAQSAVAAGQLELALRANDSALKKPQAPTSWRRYKVYLLSRLERYREAAALAATILTLSDTDPARWRNLIELQRAAGDVRAAAATAELAYDRGVLSRADDVMQLAKLYLASGLPDHAAVTLIQHHERAPANEATLAMLLRAQRGAGSLPDALVTSRQLSELSASPDHLLIQAQLEHELQDSAAATRTLRRALREDLGTRRGQALLLLGENLVASGSLRQARRVFREASDIGGVYRDALNWLSRLEQLDREQDTETLSADAASAPSTALAIDVETAPPATIELDIRRLPRLRFFHATESATLATLPAVARKLQRRVGLGLRRERLSAAGPLRWRVDGRALVEGRDSPLELGVPVNTSVPPRGRFRNTDLAPITAAVRAFDGDITTLGSAWQQLIADVIADGHTPGSDARTVVMQAPDAGGRGGRYELQLELVEAP
jgi:tetratricopeptide (TPR) repeat protein